MSASALALIWCPFANADEAGQAARTLLEERLIACANILPAMTSIFSWEGKIHEASEAGMLCKTESRLLTSAITRLAELHTYDTPAIVGWLATETAPETLSWLGKELFAGVAK